jgi:RimJ/RimL family protein N-acetyltransferase
LHSKREDGVLEQRGASPSTVRLGLVVSYTISRVSTRLETARLVIRAFEPADAGAWVALFSDPEVGRFLPPAPAPTLEEFQGAVESRHAMEREIGYAMWAVEATTAGEFLGQCGLRPAAAMDANAGSEIDLSYHFVRGSCGKGYATEAATAVLAHAIGPLGLDEVMAVATSDNVGSWRVMEKAGMRYEGSASYYRLDGLKKYVAERTWWRPPLIS